MGVARASAFPGSVEVGPYSQASLVDGLLFTTGQIPARDGGLETVPEDFAAQARATLENLRALLAANGAELADVVKVNAYLTAKEQLDPFNAACREMFGEVRPSRTTVCIAALWGVALEVEAVARPSRLPGAVTPDGVDERFERVELATLGHTLEEGFLEAGLRRIAGVGKIVGRARTLRLAEPDAIAVNEAIRALEPGDVLCIDLGEHAAHAPVGAVTQAAVRAQGGRGILVEGIVTDRQALEDGLLPVHARGVGARTTKRLGAGAHELDVPVTIGGQTIRPGDLVLADADGALVLDEARMAEAVALLDDALASDEAEPELLRRLAAGERVGPLAG